MIQKPKKAEESKTASPDRITVTLSKDIDVTQLRTMILKVSCTDNDAEFAFLLRNVDESKRDGLFTIETAMSWENLASMLTEKLEMLCTKESSEACFRLERIVSDNIEAPLDEKLMS